MPLFFKMIQITNRHAGSKPPVGEPMVVYVGRPSILENPDVLFDESNRDQIVDKHMTYLRAEYAKKERIYQELQRLAEYVRHGGELALECWCYPRRCHAENIRLAIEGINQEFYSKNMF